MNNHSNLHDYSMIRYTPSPLVLVKEGQIKEISLLAVRLLGGETPDRYIDMDFCTTFQILPQERDRFHAMYREAVNKPMSISEESGRFSVTGPDKNPGEIFLTFSSFSTFSLNDKDLVLIGLQVTPSGIGDHDKSALSIRDNDAIFKDNPALMLILDPSFDIIDVNSAWIQKSGYSRVQLLSMNLKDLSVFSRSGDTIDRAIREKRAISGEMVLDTPNGRLALVYHYTPVFHSRDRNEIESLLAVYFDVTENRSLQRKNQLMIEKNPTLFFILDKSLNITEANPSW
ncbi:MAG TPA: PAS domain-containing protein, partial [Methanospirillum sp.]|uniref:PAS domain-containing protein n=1 Tax=Methanospirillum sp. TaxID=45200 RepID=UPI002BAAE31D